MLIPTRQVPQADNLDDIPQALVSIADGRNTYQEIADAIHKVERQGRYYRLAAELLGLVERVGANDYALTKRGRALLNGNAAQATALIAEGMLEMPLFQRILPFIEAHRPSGCTREELEAFIAAVTAPTGSSMVHRRTSTILSWMVKGGLAQKVGDCYRLLPLPSAVPLVRYRSSAEPLLPSAFDLHEYSSTRQRTRAARALTPSLIEAVRRERADRAHSEILDLLAAKVRLSGSVPRSNSLVDLAANISDDRFIFEVKSTTPANVRAQVRRGVSQLYEYRYIQNAPQAQLVLVIENPLPAHLEWMIDYLSKDRDIAVLWDGNRSSFTCDQRHERMLRPLL